MTTDYECAGKDLLYRMSLCLHALTEQMQELEAIRGTHLEQAFPCERDEVRYVTLSSLYYRYPVYEDTQKL